MRVVVEGENGGLIKRLLGLLLLLRLGLELWLLLRLKLLLWLGLELRLLLVRI